MSEIHEVLYDNRSAVSYDADVRSDGKLFKVSVHHGFESSGVADDLLLDIQAVSGADVRHLSVTEDFEGVSKAD
jgi:hypothetical protein